MRPHVVAVPVLDGMPVFDIGVAGEVFGMPRPDLLPRPYEVQVCGIGDEPVRLQGAPLVLRVDACLDVLRSADTVVVPALASFDATVPGELVDALQEAFQRGTRIASVCTGASPWPRPGCSTGAGPPRTGCMQRPWPSGSPPSTSTRTCSTRWTARSRRRPAPLRGSTFAWSSCAGTTGRRSLPRWPGGSSCPRTGRAARPSTSQPPCRRSPTRRWRPCWTGRGPAWTSSSP